jgi:hypothetical protein
MTDGSLRLLPYRHNAEKSLSHAVIRGPGNQKLPALNAQKI